MMRFESISVLDEEHRGVLYRWLRDHNIARNGAFVTAMEQGASKPLAVISRTPEGTMLGGLIGETVLDWLRVHLMAVDPQYRRKGIGAQLLAYAENVAKARGCSRAYVETMSYQSPDFYRKSGYTEVGHIPNWDSQGNTKYLFTKQL